MRITNKIIQNNSLSNINSNKVLQDKLSTNIATEKKISRPSDDPIIALRSLRLRTSVNQTDQYRSRNVEDAKSWLTVTEDAIGTLSDIITDVRKQYVKGSNDPLAPSDRRIIHENLDALAKEIYNTGNADFAGRNVFTGYRTDTTLTFPKDYTKAANNEINYAITETKDSATVDTRTYVYQDPSDETKVTNNEIVRVRFSYDNLDSFTDGKITFAGDTTARPITVQTVSATTATVADPANPGSYLSENPYDYVINHPEEAVFVPETGELLLGAKLGCPDPGTEPDPADTAAHAEWEAKKAEADSYVLTNEKIDSFDLAYNKSEWKKGDLRPQHYFMCDDTTNNIAYNYEMQEEPAGSGNFTKKFNSPDAEICYNIGVNQSIRINTTAGECFDHSIVRELQDVISAISDVEDIEAKIKTLEADLEKFASNDTASRTAKQNEIDAAKKAQTFLNERLHSLFSKGIGFADEHLAANNLALTNCGTRSKRLELIENRLDTQLSTLKELKSENEDVDMAETAIKLSSAKYAYDASLMATSKAIQQTLLNYL